MINPVTQPGEKSKLRSRVILEAERNEHIDLHVDPARGVGMSFAPHLAPGLPPLFVLSLFEHVSTFCSAQDPISTTSHSLVSLESQASALHI